MAEDEKKYEDSEKPEEILHKTGQEMQELQEGIIDKNITRELQPEKQELDKLQNTILQTIEQKNDGNNVEEEQTIIKNDTSKVQNKVDTQVYKPIDDKESILINPEVIIQNQTKSRLNIEEKLVPIAGMPTRLLNKQNINGNRNRT